MVQATLESGDRNEADSAPLATIERQAARARRTACAVLRFLQSLRRSHTALPISPHTGHLHNVSPSSGEVQTSASRPHTRGVRDPCSAQPPPVCHCTTLVLCALHSCSHPTTAFGRSLCLSLDAGRMPIPFHVVCWPCFAATRRQLRRAMPPCLASTGPGPAVATAKTTRARSYACML